MVNGDPNLNPSDRRLKAFAKEFVRQELGGLLVGSMVLLFAISTRAVLIKFFPSLSQFWFGFIIFCSILVGATLGFLLVQAVETNPKEKPPSSA
jgi:hypothetical protein